MSVIPSHVRLLLAELELLSHGSTASWNPAGGQGGDDAPAPFGEQRPPHVEMRAAYIAETTPDGQRRVVGRMHAVLREYRGVGVDRSLVVGESRDDEDRRICREGEGFTLDEVALRFRCTPTRVRRARIAEGRDVVFGRRPDSAAAAIEDPAGEARRMKANGMSERQIAFALGQHRTTVSRWLKKAA